MVEKNSIKTERKAKGVGVGMRVGCQHRMLHVPIQKSFTHPMLKHTAGLLSVF